MLYLSRKEGQSIIIYNNKTEIKIEVIEIKGKNVKLGIKSPEKINENSPDIRVFREEIYEKVMKENMQATILANDDEASNIINKLNKLKVGEE